MTSKSADLRVAWVDAAKGLCILLVVLMHATLGVEKATGTATALNGFIDWAKPFRMPDFFLISGLFLAARIDRLGRVEAEGAPQPQRHPIARRDAVVRIEAAERLLREAPAEELAAEDRRAADGGRLRWRRSA